MLTFHKSKTLKIMQEKQLLNFKIQCTKRKNISRNQNTASNPKVSNTCVTEEGVYGCILCNHKFPPVTKYNTSFEV